MALSWFLKDEKCKACGFEVVITQPLPDDPNHNDYLYYCSNKTCKNHAGEGRGDQDPSPDWCNSEDFA